MSNKLLPCPFCGGEAEVTTRDVEPQGDPWYGQNTQTFIVCAKCGACLFDEYFHDGFTDEREAVAAWNRRSDAVPVVRCRECRHYAAPVVARDTGLCLWADRDELAGYDGYCSRGARMEDT